MKQIQKFSMVYEHRIQLQLQDEEFTALSKKFCFNKS
jgi:hypothetical protein